MERVTVFFPSSTYSRYAFAFPSCSSSHSTTRMVAHTSPLPAKEVRQWELTLRRLGLILFLDQYRSQPCDTGASIIHLLWLRKLRLEGFEKLAPAGQLACSIVSTKIQAFWPKSLYLRKPNSTVLFWRNGWFHGWGRKMQDEPETLCNAE